MTEKNADVIELIRDRRSNSAGTPWPKRVVFSSGIGKLHIIQLAVDLKAAHPEVEVMLVTSWVPGNIMLCLLRAVGLGKISRRLEVRREAAKALDVTTGFLLPELIYLLFKRVIGAEAALGVGFVLHGRLSAWWMTRYLDGDTVLHLRSGGGNRLVDVAHHKGASVVVDHSIAHPASFTQYLANVSQFIPPGTLDETSPIWRQVVSDCDNADLILVNSDFVKQTFLAQGYEADQIKVAYLSVPREFSEITRAPAQNTEQFNILFSGHFDVRKGADLLLRIMSRLHETHPGVRLHVAGSISDSGQAIINELGASIDIIFHGFLPKDDLKNLLASCDLFVFPTYLEGCAKAVMEAMAAGLPVLTTPQAGSPILDGVNGYILETRDPEIWAQVIADLRANPEKARQVGATARKTLANDFSGNAYSDRLLDIYRGLKTK